MALTGTTLAAAITANDLDVSVAAVPSGVAQGHRVRIGDEWAVVDKVQGTIVSLRTRGDNGTVARAHNILTPIHFGSTAADFASIPPARHRGGIENIDGFVTYGAAGAIALPEKDTTAVLAGSSALAMTLPDPTRMMDGIKLKITSSGAAAHTVTSATGFNAGGASVDVGTFAAAVGNGLVLEAISGKWVVQSNTGVTLA